MNSFFFFTIWKETIYFKRRKKERWTVETKEKSNRRSVLYVFEVILPFCLRKRRIDLSFAEIKVDSFPLWRVAFKNGNRGGGEKGKSVRWPPASTPTDNETLQRNIIDPSRFFRHRCSLFSLSLFPSFSLCVAESRKRYKYRESLRSIVPRCIFRCTFLIFWISISILNATGFFWNLSND